MADVCKAHGLVAAADGRCVVCRRPPWETSDQTKQGARQQALTVILGLCLIAALERVVQLGLVDSAARMEPRGIARGSQLTAAPPPQTPVATDATVGADAAVAAGQEEATAQPSETATTQADTAEMQSASETAKPDAPASPAPKRPRPSPEALAQARKQVRVVMYASPWCTICDHARSQLLAHDVQLVEHDIDADPQAARRLAKRNPSATVPTFEIGDDTLVGYNPWQLQDAVDAIAISTIASPKAGRRARSD